MKLVDADVLIDLSRNREEAVKYIVRHPDFSVLGVSVFTKLELLDGASNKREMTNVLDFLRSLILARSIQPDFR